jgi:hypothetical protein
MATSFGTTTGLFGIAAQQTGFLLDSVSDDYSQDSKTVKNISGDDTGESYYNERIEGTLDGYIPSTSAFSGSRRSPDWCGDWRNLRRDRTDPLQHFRRLPAYLCKIQIQSDDPSLTATQQDGITKIFWHHRRRWCYY